jgi:methyl-accepting chemotaxis protein
MSQLSQATQHNAAASEQLAATAEEMSGQAGQLQQLMEFFTVEQEARMLTTHAPRLNSGRKLALPRGQMPKALPRNF